MKRTKKKESRSVTSGASSSRGTEREEDISSSLGPSHHVKTTESAQGGTRKPKPQFVVVIDFGTTFSGFSYGVLQDLVDKADHLYDYVHLFENWPSQSRTGTKYCKTQTSVWYVPTSERDVYELRGWGWAGYSGYQKALQDVRDKWRDTKQGPPSFKADRRKWEREKVGHFITKFKLGLYDKTQIDLPNGLTLETVISDFLRQMSFVILGELANKYGGSKVSKSKIKFCLTVPAMWTEGAKQKMKECAQAAGIVKGPHCPDKNASPFELGIVLEPESASAHCAHLFPVVDSAVGESILVVDVGGGTSDSVLHRKVMSADGSRVMFTEAAASTGVAVGGTHVDEQFLKYFRRKIPCFEDFEDLHPGDVLSMRRNWEDIKANFDGESPEDSIVTLHPLLAQMWAKSMNKSPVSYSDLETYSELRLPLSTLKKMFDSVVDRVLDLISEQMNEMEDKRVDVILLVGGFSMSPYLCKRVRARFGAQVRDVIVPPNPGSAVLKGAIAWGTKPESDFEDTFLRARIAKCTYGFETTCFFQKGKHRADYMVVERGTKRRMCDNIFQILVRKGDPIPVGKKVTRTSTVLYREDMAEDDSDIEMVLYASESKYPTYVTDAGVRKVAKCLIKVPTLKEASLMRTEPTISICLSFSGTIINGRARTCVGSHAIRFQWLSETERRL